MAFIPASQVTIATGQIWEQFAYFSRPITIYKEPAQTIVSNPQNILYGYNVESQTTNSEITLSSESQIFSGLIIYPFKVRNQQSQMFDNKIVINPNSTYVKLENSAKNYILDGRKVEKLEFDSQTWNFTEGNKFQTQFFLGLSFYYFEVKGTN